MNNFGEGNGKGGGEKINPIKPLTAEQEELKRMFASLGIDIKGVATNLSKDEPPAPIQEKNPENIPAEATDSQSKSTKIVDISEYRNKKSLSKKPLSALAALTFAGAIAYGSNEANAPKVDSLGDSKPAIEEPIFKNQSKVDRTTPAVVSEIINIKDPEILSNPAKLALASDKAFSEIPASDIVKYFKLEHFKTLSISQLELLNKEYLKSIDPKIFADSNFDLKQMRAILPGAGEKFKSIWGSKDFAKKFFYIVGSPSLTELQAKIGADEPLNSFTIYGPIDDKKRNFQYTRLFPRISTKPNGEEEDWYFSSPEARNNFVNMLRQMVLPTAK